MLCAHFYLIESVDGSLICLKNFSFMGIVLNETSQITKVEICRRHTFTLDKDV